MSSGSLLEEFFELRVNLKDLGFSIISDWWWWFDFVEWWLVDLIIAPEIDCLLFLVSGPSVRGELNWGEIGEWNWGETGEEENSIKGDNSGGADDDKVDNCKLSVLMYCCCCCCLSPLLEEDGDVDVDDGDDVDADMRGEIVSKSCGSGIVGRNDWGTGDGKRVTLGLDFSLIKKKKNF